MTEPLHALVVEDSLEMAQRLFALLDRPHRLKVVATCSTEDFALQVCDRARIDIAVIDLQLAKGTGFGVIRRLRSAHNPNPVVIIVLTNHAVPALKVAAFEAGCDFFLDKSRDFATLPRLIGEFLETARAA
jgi:DNA-binding response OmpR family regulator